MMMIDSGSIGLKYMCCIFLCVAFSFTCIAVSDAMPGAKMVMEVFDISCKKLCRNLHNHKPFSEQAT